MPSTIQASQREEHAMSAGIKFKLGPPDDQFSEVSTLCENRDPLSHTFLSTRQVSRAIADPLSPEDQTIQSMPDVSPTKWHLGHTTWFFETFLLKSFVDDYQEFDSWFPHIFNSYYYSVGEMHARTRRGLLSRPDTATVLAYRSHVDEAMTRLLTASRDMADRERIEFLTTLGIHHEQQHQELMLTDIKHVLSCNPMKPAAYGAPLPGPMIGETAPLGWSDWDGGIRAIGHEGDGFTYDNETPRHNVLMRPFSLASRPVTNGEFMQFVEDGGYETVSLWLSDGWATVCSDAWRHPFYWSRRDGVWHEFTLHGLVPLDPTRPVAHVSFYEAQAFANWSGCRLPTEAELEIALADAPVSGNLLDIDLEAGHPMVAPEPRALDQRSASRPGQLFGDVWEWTASPYSPYPGFRPLDGPLAEYNGKFMCNQLVLKGGSCATPVGHIRAAYRNFFPPDARWQFSGIRLARDEPS